MAAKDYFSKQANLYATFRPSYPEELYQFIFQHVKDKETVWDCATGNGQAAAYLSNHFKKVCATDISEKQLAYAYQADNISYSIAPAEQTSFQDDQFDLITVGQALHWFDLPRFYAEVKRVIKPDGILAAWGYNLLTISPEIDALILNFYQNTVGRYWDDARRFVETSYQPLPFPGEEIPAPSFYFSAEWTLENLEGYLMTWSSTQAYIKANNSNPVINLLPDVEKLWPAGVKKQVTFPIFIRLAAIPK